MKLSVFASVLLFASLYTETGACQDGTRYKPAKSCWDIYNCKPDSPSGYYYVYKYGFLRSTVHCDMDSRICGVKGGWMKIASLDMRRSTTCPSGFRRETSGSKRFCVKDNTIECSSHTYSTSGLSYAEVCGKAIGYAYGSPDTSRHPRSIEEAYADGVSITHGSSPRKHIWTYMSGYTESSVDELAITHRCPCTTTGIALKYNHFISNDYYCESGNPHNGWQSKWYLDDPLWDGAGCSTGNNCCSYSGLPYFHRTLPRVTTDNIEVRLCADEPRSNEDIGLEQLELYVR